LRWGGLIQFPVGNVQFLNCGFTDGLTGPISCAESHGNSFCGAIAASSFKNTPNFDEIFDASSSSIEKGGLNTQTNQTYLSRGAINKLQFQ